MANMELTPIFYHEGSRDAMTNEELAVLIKGGERNKLPELWEQVRRFAHGRAYKWAIALNGRGGVTVEDFEQAAFLALLDAVERFDPAAGYAFITFLGNSIKAAFTQAAGLRTKREQMDPLSSALSLDVPVTEDGDEGLGDFIEDPQAVQAFEDIEGLDLHEAIESAIHKLPENQQAVIRCRYYRGLTTEQTGQVLGISRSAVKQAEEKALRVLRHPANSRELRRYM